MSQLSLFEVIRRSPYRGFFVGEGFQAFGLAAGTTGLVIQVASDTGNAALSVGVMVAPSVAAVVFSPVVTPVLKRLGFYQGLVSSYVLAILAILAITAVSAGTMAASLLAIILMFILGAVNTIHTPAVFATLSWLVGEANIPKGIASTQVRQALAWVIGPIVGASLVAVSGGRVLLLIVAATYVIALVPYLANRQLFRTQQQQLLAEMQEDPDAMASLMETGVEEYQDANRCQVSLAPSPGAWGFLALLKHRNFAFVIAVALVIYLVLGTFSSLTGPWLVIDVGVAMMATGAFYSVRSIASLPGAFLVEWATERIGVSKTLLLFSGLIAGGTLIAAAGSTWLPLAYLGMAIFGISYYSATTVLSLSLIALVFGKSLRVQAQTLFSFSKGIASFAFIGVGVLADSIGITTVLIGASVVGMGMLLFMRYGLAGMWNEMVVLHDCEREAAKEPDST